MDTDEEHQNRLAAVAAELQARSRQEAHEKKLASAEEKHREEIIKEYEAEERRIQMEFVRLRRGEEKTKGLKTDLLEELESGQLARCPLFRWNDCPKDLDGRTHILFRFGTGQAGVCFLVATPGGTVCVRKMFYNVSYWMDMDVRRKACAECDVWEKIYANHLGFDSSEAYQNEEGHSILLPYIRALSDTEEGEIKEQKRLLEEGDQGALAQALHFVAKQGYRHLSIKWKHVGRESLLPESRIVFFDLGRVEQPTEWQESDQEAWVQECLRNLRSEMERHQMRAQR
jgi:Family of unknown function (DUF5898)